MLGKPWVRTGFIAFPMSVLQECNTFDRHFSNSNRIILLILFCWLTIHCQRRIRLNQENVEILNCPTKPKGVTTQRKALNEYFVMVVLTLSLNTVLNILKWCLWFAILNFLDANRKKMFACMKWYDFLLYNVYMIKIVWMHCGWRIHW